MKKFLLLLTLPFLMLGCDNDDPTPIVKPTAPITIYAYLVAENNLDDDLLSNIGAMYDGMVSVDKEATLLVYWDGKSTIQDISNPMLLRYQADGEGKINGLLPIDTNADLDDVLDVAEVVKEYPEQMSTDSKVMSQVLKDMVNMTTTEKIGLVVGSHASSWLNTIYTSRAFGQDGSGTDNTMLIPDMVNALKSVNRTFDFILFDACYMATAEVAYMFREVANYQLASVMEVPAYGFPYEDFMKNLYTGTMEGYKSACQTYIEYYQGLAWATVTLTDSKEMANLTNELKKEIIAHKDALTNYNTSSLQEYGKDNGPYIAVDLGHLVEDLNDGTLPASFTTQLDKTVLYKGCIEKASPSHYSVDAANYSGLGIYVPVERRPKWNQYFKTLDWYTASGWNEVTFSWHF